mgnify:FL=1
MELISHFFYAISIRTFLIIATSIGATASCEYFSIVGDMPTSLIGLAVVFPLVFSINASFQRRDEALQQYGTINANLASLYFAHKSWIPPPKKIDGHGEEIMKLAISFLKILKDDLTNEKSPPEMKSEIYNIFENFSKKMKFSFEKIC